jgi:hypothetical protein
MDLNLGKSNSRFRLTGVGDSRSYIQKQNRDVFGVEFYGYEGTVGCKTKNIRRMRILQHSFRPGRVGLSVGNYKR